jgi:hypothetical protein
MILNFIPTGMKVKSAILFSTSLTILSRPLLRNIPELVRTLKKGCLLSYILYLEYNFPWKSGDRWGLKKHTNLLSLL